MIINEFWFNYRSAPTLVKRRFGPAGRPIAAAAAWAGRNHHLAYSRAFQKARKFATDRVGGDAHFEPDHVIDISLQMLRRIMSAEGAVPLVIGPMGGMDHLLPPSLRDEGASRRMKVHLALKQFCEAHHIEYWGLDHPVYLNMPKRERSTLPDGIHSDAEGVKRTLAYWSPQVARFLLKVKQDQDAARQESLS